MIDLHPGIEAQNITYIFSSHGQVKDSLDISWKMIELHLSTADQNIT